MINFSKTWILCIIVIVASSIATSVSGQERTIPDELKPWEQWATWDDVNRNSPALFNDPKKRISFWPSRLTLDVDSDQGTWNVSVRVFSDAWIPLPGNNTTWPQKVTSNGEPVPVVEHSGRPSVKLNPGRYQISGEFSWDRMPQKIAVPNEIGLLALSVEGEPVTLPNWDASGEVWLKRRTEVAAANSTNVQVYRAIQDGIPIWLHTDVELTVSGKSREEELGWILPEGWKLATVDSRIPVAVDEQGQMKAQVRAGKWTISVRAFRVQDTREIKYAEGAMPTTDVELVAFMGKPEFRLAEVTGLVAVDVSQTTMPQKWRGLPIYQWATNTAINLDEKMRGMGQHRPEGLRVQRTIWLDEDGKAITYHDDVSGNMQQLWRLDSAKGQELGAVRVNGKGQLITINPTTGDQGVELRNRNLHLEAIGRIPSVDSIPATGWQTDADSLGMTITLPPGWRVLALFGADGVQGDWLTAWSLLDLFLLLIFSLAVFRIWGVWAGLVAFIAFGLAFHEPGSPRFTWLFLLMPIALLRVVPDGAFQAGIKVWKYVAVALLALFLVPFIGQQIQSALYPQLERAGVNYSGRMFGLVGGIQSDYPAAHESSAQVDQQVAINGYADHVIQPAQQAQSIKGQPSKFRSSNLLYSPKARIQTGPAQPDWTWNQVHCYWDGPVAADQSIRPILITRNQHRALSAVRVVLLLWLTAIVLSDTVFPFPKRAAQVAAGLLVCTLLFCPSQAIAQDIPNAQQLELLRKRLLEPSDAFPRAGEIALVELSIEDNKTSMMAEVHSAAEAAIPLPGKLPKWSPVSVKVDGKPAELICRHKDFLWVVLPSGVHRVEVESILPDVSEWDWTFLLKPRQVSINAPGWNVTGLRPNGIPENQIFFARQQQVAEGEASYDRKVFNAVVAVDRHIETGLLWQVRTSVTRLLNTEKAVSIKVPLLTGENVLTSNMVVEDGNIEVRLGAGQNTFTWTSELPVGQEIELTAPETDQWVERWHLLTSPVWNVNQDGLAPIFESGQENLIPVWSPWPNESVKLTFHEPTAVVGDTITVQRVTHETAVGRRQRNMTMTIDLECSLGGDFLIGLEDDAEVAALSVGENQIPVRKDGSNLVVPVRPGKQTVNLNWHTNRQLQIVETFGHVKLPVESANITSSVNIPESRWILWTQGPTRGPAVRFWIILIFALLVALLLGSVKMSPLNHLEWMLLAIGLTQVHVGAAMLVIGWLFLLANRGKSEPSNSTIWLFNLRQILIVLLTLASLGIFVSVVAAGLLGSPRMFILGNGSYQTFLNWFEPRIDSQLPETTVITISVWYYRLFMLFWALWLAFSLLKWLATGWKHFSHGGCWAHSPTIVTDASIVIETASESPGEEPAE